MLRPGSASSSTSTHTPLAQVRFDQLIHGESGETMGSLAHAYRQYEDAPTFGAFKSPLRAPSPAEWLAEHIEQIGLYVGASNDVKRPIIVQAPLLSLAHSDTLMACLMAAQRVHLCPQEICIEFPDTAFAKDPDQAFAHIERFRQSGFRVGIDMRRAQKASLSAGLCMMLETLRLSGQNMLQDIATLGLAETAAHAGINVIAQRPRWRDAEKLAQSGIFMLINPRADA